VRFGLEIRAYSVEYVVDKVAVGQVTFRDHLFHFSVIMPPVLRINLLTTDAVESKKWQQSCINPVTPNDL
jgi:hypothetical protein